MHIVECTTATDGLSPFGYENGSYPIQVNVPDTLAEGLAKIGKCSEDEIVIEAPEGAQAAVLGVVTASWTQNAKQGKKGTLRDAIAEGDQEKVDKAVADHQVWALGYVPGAPRGSAVGGVTKTRAGNFGKKLLEKYGAEKLKAIAMEHGIDPDDLS